MVIDGRAHYATAPREVELSRWDGQLEHSLLKLKNQFCKKENYDKEIAKGLIKLFRDSKITDKSKLGCLRLVSENQFKLFVEEVRREKGESVINIFYKTLKPSENINEKAFSKVVERLRTVLYKHLVTKMPTDINNGKGIEILEKYLRTKPPQNKVESLLKRIEVMPRDMDAEDTWETIDATVKRYEQLSKAEIEEGEIPAHENLQMSLFIEDKLKKAINADGRVMREGEHSQREMGLDLASTRREVSQLSPSTQGEQLVSLFNAATLQDSDAGSGTQASQDETLVTLPRTIILKDGNIIILSHRDTSLLQYEDNSRRITSAVRVPLDDLAAEPEKVTNVELKTSEIDVRDRWKKQGVLQHEWRIMEKLNGEKGFVQGYYRTGYSNENEAHIILPGSTGTLLDFEDQVPYGDVQQHVSVAEQLLDQVSLMHKKEIVHMNIKPENILVNAEKPDVTVSISNFEHARILKKKKGLESDEYGDRRYAPPELADSFAMVASHQTLKQSDGWALGLTLFRLRHGEVFPIGRKTSDFLKGGGEGFGLGYNIDEMDPVAYERMHKEYIENQLQRLLTIPENDRDPGTKYDIIILKLLRYNPKDRISLEDALAEIRKLKNV